MKKLIVGLFLALTACGGGDSGKSTRSDVSDFSKLPPCDLRKADFSLLVGSYASSFAASQALMSWATSFALAQQCRIDSDNLASNLERNIQLEFQDREHLNVKLKEGR